uniref:Putative terminase n=1 Tax=viral metagenome TaxID=1070528 RepID=A0A6M3IP17_9ZZZZ
MGKATHRLSPKMKAFLVAMEQTGNISAAAQASRVARRSHYMWMDRSQGYREAFAVAKEHAADLMEIEARKRAMEGVVEPVIRKDDDGVWRAVGGIRRYSDTLLIFLLKAARPEKYRERHEVTHDNLPTMPGEILVRLEDDGTNQIHGREEVLRELRKKEGENGRGANGRGA